MRAFTMVMVLLTLWWISYGVVAEETDSFNLSWLAAECRESFSDDESTASYRSSGICTGYVIASYELFVRQSLVAVCSDIAIADVTRAIKQEVVVLSEAIGPEQSKALPAAAVLMANWIERAGCDESGVRVTFWL